MDKLLPPYAGKEPFVFVCYAHADAGVVYPELSRLQGCSFHLWYDKGISPGSQWSEVLVDRIEECATFLYFVTPTSVVLENCRRELNFALDQHCAILAVHLQETEVPMALEPSLSNRQAILRYEHSSAQYEAKLDEAIRDAVFGLPDASITDSARALQIGDWLLDLGSQRLLNGDEAHMLAPKDLGVLIHLAEAAPDYVTSKALLERTWTGSVVGDNTLHQVIGRLRKILGEDAHQPFYLETLPRRGYRLMAPVHEVRADHQVPIVTARMAPVHVHPARWYRSQWVRVVLATASILLLGVSAMLIISERQAPAVPGDQPEIDNQKSMAVFPFDSPSGDQDARFLAASLTRTLRGQVTEIRGVSVVNFEDIKLPLADPDGVASGDIPELLFKGAVRRSPDGIQVNTQLVRTRDGTLVYTDVFERQSDQLLVVADDMVDSMVAALRIHLDEDRYQTMVDHGTHNARAFLAVQDSHRLFSRMNPGATAKAMQLLNLAITLDPDYVNAHVRLLVAYGNARWIVDQKTRRRLGQGIERLLARLEVIAAESDPIVRWSRSFVTDDLLQLESDLRNLIVDIPEPTYLRRCGIADIMDEIRPGDIGCHWMAYPFYAALLAGADLPHTAAAFLERVRTEGGLTDVWLTGPGARVAQLLIGAEARVSLLKTSLANKPADLPALRGVVDGLTTLGRHEEAGYYLEQLYRYDSYGIWAHNADHVRRARMGELALDSPELQAYLNNPRSSHLSKAQIFLLLGDVERGVEQLGQLKDTTLHIFALGRSIMERSLPTEVVADARYRGVLEKLGVGDSWRRFLIEKVNEMEQHTGIGYPTRASISIADIYGSTIDD